ncbi:MAG: hypothetical protein HC837_20325, partial [Chloroflexaceae bacterium]|nr:hypothetical protein [Chloroflexaceae bacterium]
MLSILTVYGSVTLLAWLNLPLWRATAHLHRGAAREQRPNAADCGSGIARLLVFVITGWLSWWLAAAGAGQAAFVLAAMLMVLIGGAGWWRDYRATWAWLRTHWRHLLFIETLGLAIYLALLLFRGWTADITTIEKYTNLAIINSIGLSPAVPPPNAWFGGHPLNYYYLGHWMLALLSQISRLPPNNLVIFATPLLAAMCAQACVTIIATLNPAHYRRWSLLAVFLLLVCGSWNETVHGLMHWPAEWQRSFFQSQIPNPIIDDLAPNGYLFEFPAVSLLWGEMHAHALGLPLILAVLALLARHYSAPPTETLRTAVVAALTATLVGIGYAVNSWQYPPLLAFCLLVHWWHWWHVQRTPIWRPLLFTALFIGIGLLAIAPFLLSFTPFAPPPPAESGLQPLPFIPGGMLVWSPVGTPLMSLLLAIGLPLLLAGAAALALLERHDWRWGFAWAAAGVG